MSPPQEVNIRAVPRDEQVAALWLLFGAEPEAVRRDRVAASVRAAGSGSVNFDYLLEARRGERRVGVIWGQVLPGRNANIWPAFLEPGEPESTCDLLQSALDERLANAGLAMAQAMLPLSAEPSASCLRRNGYVNVVNLLYLVIDADRIPQEQPKFTLQFQPFHEDAARLVPLLDATYVGTQDAPDLNGVRDTMDVIEGYKATGRFDPRRWWFVQYQGNDVGCLILAEHPDLKISELIYMGLVPEARGKGLAKEMVRFAQWQAKQIGSQSLLVSVDSANAPAVSVYSRCGFSEIDRRQVWIKRFGSSV